MYLVRIYIYIIIYTHTLTSICRDTGYILVCRLLTTKWIVNCTSVNTGKKPIKTQTWKPSFSLKLFWAIRSAGVFPCLWSQWLLLALCSQNHLPQLGSDTGVFASQWQTLVPHADTIAQKHAFTIDMLVVCFIWVNAIKVARSLWQKAFW